jgi:hypothetical protein
MQTYFDNFMIINKDNLETCECLIPDFLRSELHSNKLTLKYRIANSDWLGMTYREDLEDVKNKLDELKKKGEYNVHLW